MRGENALRPGDVCTYGHRHGYAGTRLRDHDDPMARETYIRVGETFVVISGPNELKWFSDAGVPRYSYRILMMSCPERRELEGRTYDIVPDDTTDDEYLTITCRA